MLTGVQRPDPDALWMRAVRSLSELRHSLFGASLLMAQPLLLNLIGVPVTAYIIASLGASAYGQWALALTVNATALFLVNLGLRPWFVRRVAQDRDCAPSAFRDQIGTRSILALVAAFTSLTACWLLGYPREVFICASILATGMVFTALTSCAADLLQAIERMPALASINMIAGLALTAASVLVIYLDLGVYALSAAYVVGPVLSGTLSLAFIHRHAFPVRARFSFRRSLELLTEARVLGFQGMIVMLANQAENLLVPMWAGMTNYGHFAAGTLLVRRLDVIPDALCTSFYPLMARASRPEEPDPRALRRLAFLPMLLCFPPAICGFLLAGPISRILFSENAELCASVMRITIWALPLMGLASGLSYALNAARRERQETMLLVAVMAISLPFAPLLIWHFGVYGACASAMLRLGMAAAIRVPFFLGATGRSYSGTPQSLLPPVAVAQDGSPRVEQQTAG